MGVVRTDLQFEQVARLRKVRKSGFIEDKLARFRLRLASFSLGYMGASQQTKPTGQPYNHYLETASGRSWGYGTWPQVPEYTDHVTEACRLASARIESSPRMAAMAAMAASHTQSAKTGSW